MHSSNILIIVIPNAITHFVFNGIINGVVTIKFSIQNKILTMMKCINVMIPNMIASHNKQDKHPASGSLQYFNFIYFLSSKINFIYSTIIQSSASMSVWLASQGTTLPCTVFIAIYAPYSTNPFSFTMLLAMSVHGA